MHDFVIDQSIQIFENSVAVLAGVKFLLASLVHLFEVGFKYVFAFTFEVAHFATVHLEIG